MDYGLIGAKLGHSFSKPIHEQLCGYTYTLCPLPTEAEFAAFMQKKEFKAVNVTIPYKQAVIPYLSGMSARAKAIGAVNTIVNRGGQLYGDNTDFAGFLYMVHRTGYALAGKKVLVLGTGGTHKTVLAALQSDGAAEVHCVSRTPQGDEISYAQAAACTDTQVIINTTPVGMYPHCGQSPLCLAPFGQLEAVFDVVYNPLQTRLLADAAQKGGTVSNGLPMLVAQAKYAAEVFLDTQIAEEKIEAVLAQMKAQTANLVLVGMPSCGKTSIGKALSKALQKTFVDVDAEIEKHTGKTIPAIFAAEGEAGFRKIESEITADICAHGAQVIATGGGVVTQPQNMRPLRQNGVVIYIDRPLADLQTGGNRPLSTSKDALAKMKNERAPLYKQAAHATVSNTGNFAAVAREIEEKFYEILNY